MTQAHRFLALAAGLALLLAACTNAPPRAPHGDDVAAVSSRAQALAQDYAELARSGGRVFKLDPAASAVRILVFRGGAAARLGHNHVVSTPRFVGFVHVPEAGASQARFDLEFRLDELRLDDPAVRAEAGDAFSTVLSPEAISATRDHMLEADDLDADHFPFVRVQSLQITGELPQLAARVRVELHGQAREFAVPLRIDGLPDRIRVSGRFVLRQSDFGIRPYSVAGGLLSVQDDLIVDFRLDGR